ncbi:MAG: hypothetical protein FWD11_02335, partial [Micrococcales bacterium]|nr:hypothetical protein [Micrococcales bacterium]
MRRVLGLLVGALLVATIGGCSSDGSDSPSSPAPRATQHAPAREALAAGLAKDDPTKADLVAEPETRLEPVEAPWLQGWQVFDVQSFTEYPQRFYAAVSDEGTAFVLSGRPDSFNTMVRDAKVVVDDEGIAADIAAVFLDVTRTFQTFSYRIDDLDEVQWRSVLNSDQQQRRSD